MNTTRSAFALVFIAALIVGWLGQPAPTIQIAATIKSPTVEATYLRPVAFIPTLTPVPIPTIALTVERTADNPPDISDRSGYTRRLEVRLTFYVDRGTTRYGCPTLPGMASTDPRVIPPGTIFRLVGDSRLYYACDTGGGVKGAHVDVWMPSLAEGYAYIQQYGDWVTIEIVQE